MKLTLEQINDRIEIESVLNLYAHYLDSGQFERVAEAVFTEDGSIDFGGDRAEGRDAIQRQVMGYKDALLGCSHNITNVFIEVDGDAARSASRIMAWHWFAKPDADPFGETDFLAIGGYEDRWRRTPQGWRISERRGMNFGTGVGVGDVPAPMRAILQKMQGRKPTWPV